MCVGGDSDGRGKDSVSIRCRGKLNEPVQQTETMMPRELTLSASPNFNLSEVSSAAMIMFLSAFVSAEKGGVKLPKFSYL